MGSEAATVTQLPNTTPGAGLIYRAMPAIMAEVGAVEKGRRNQQQGYNFRGIDDVYAAVQLVMAKHGVFVAPTKILSDDWSERATKSGGIMFHLRAKIQHTFYAADGSHFATETFGEGMDTGDKSSNKAMSAAIKYALLEAFSIPTQEPKDPENDSPDVAGPKAAPPVAPSGARPANNTGASPPAPTAQTPAMESTPAPSEPLITPAQVKRLMAAVTKLLPGNHKEPAVHEARISWLRWAVGEDDLTSSKQLTEEQATKAIARAETGEMPDA